MQLLPILFVSLCCVANLSAQETNARSLFNGKDLSGWTGAGFAVENESIVCTTAGSNLVSEEWFANYKLEFDFMLPDGATSGVGLHYSGSGDPAYSGMRLQLLDNASPKHQKLSPSQRNNSIFLLTPAKPSVLKPSGEWNHQSVTVTNAGLMIMLNDEVLLRENLDTVRSRNPQHVGAQRRAGHIALIGNEARIAFRNIRIQESAPLVYLEGVKTAGFQNLLNREDLNGWKQMEGASWKVSAGVLKYKGSPSELWTEAEYGDYTLVFDWRWTQKGLMESAPVISADGTEKRSPTGSIELEEIERQVCGIFIRGRMPAEMNLWNWSCGSGEIHGYPGFDAARANTTPMAKADRPLGEWNRTMITVKAGAVTVLLNGQKVMENAALPGLPARGPIGLKGNGSGIDFANIWIKAD